MAFRSPLTGNLGESKGTVNDGYPVWKMRYVAKAMIAMATAGQQLLRSVNQIATTAGKMPA